MTPSGLYCTVPETQPNLTVSAARDFAAIGMIGDQPMLIAVNPRLGVTSLRELVALAQEKPGALAYGAGRGSLPHINGVRFQRQTGTSMTIVPYPAGHRHRH